MLNATLFFEFVGAMVVLGVLVLLAALLWSRWILNWSTLLARRRKRADHAKDC
jgi:hypothetical protein